MECITCGAELTGTHDKPSGGQCEGPYVEGYAQLSGEDGNAYVIMGAVQRELRHNGATLLANAYYEEATSGDYDDLLRTSMRWVQVG